MSCSHEIFEDNALAIVRMNGRVDAEALIRCAEQLYRDPRWSAGFASIWDVRLISELILMPEDVANILYLSREMIHRAGTGKRAVVVARDLEHHMATLFAVREKPLGRETQVFWDISAACEWLGCQLQAPARDYLTKAA